MKSKKKSLEARKAIAGRLFVYPWVIGFILFYGRPLVQSIWFSFNKVTLTSSGLILSYVKFNNYNYVFNQDPMFLQNLMAAVENMLSNLPSIIFFSLFIAVLLNRKFPGRAMVRGAFFLPVIITSGALMYVLGTDVQGVSSATGASQGMPMVKAINLELMLTNLIGYAPIVKQIVGIINSVYVVIWKSGVQILLFLAGLQSISPALYESANVEGATGWESFWKITMPMISPIILINIVYTVIDSFTDYSNDMLRYIIDTTFKNIQYGYASAMAWIYFSIIALILLIAVGLVSRKTFYLND